MRGGGGQEEGTLGPHTRVDEGWLGQREWGDPGGRFCVLQVSLGNLGRSGAQG